MKQQQPSKWLRISDALATLAAGYAKVDDVEKHGGFALPPLAAGVPSLNGKTNGHTNGHAKTNGHTNGHAAKALPAPQKVRKAVKALPASTETALAKTPKQVKAEARAAAKAAKAEAKATKAAERAAAKAAKGPKAAKAKAPKSDTSSAIAAGRRAVASGERPKLVDAMGIVMGEETLKAGDILARLVERGWEPGASNQQSYISYTLSDNGDTFKRVSRGEYVVKDPKKFAAVAAEFKGGKAKAAPKATAAAAAPKAKAKAAKATKAKGSKTSGKAEGVASTDASEVEAIASTQEPEAAQAPEVTAEAAPVAGDPLTSTPEAVASDATTSADNTPTDEALADLGLGADDIGDNPFEAMSH